MRLFFVILLAAHGLIHLLGFMKSQGWLQPEQLIHHISQSRGLLWMVGGVMVLVTAAMYMVGYKYWWFFGLVALSVSQGLIIMHWQDAKFGTAANLIILVGCLIGWSYWHHDRTFENEVSARVEASSPLPSPSTAQIEAIPEPLRNWLIRSEVLERSPIRSVHLEQIGKMRLKPESEWIRFEANQWFSLDPPGFLWNARVGNPGSIMQFLGKDALQDGHGSMIIKLWGFVPIVRAKGQNIDQGSMVRFIAESIWFPSYMSDTSCSWTSIDSNHVQVRFQLGDQSIEGVFGFNSSGELITFSSMRYNDATNRLERWVANIDPQSYRIFSEVRILTKVSIIWSLEGGDFHWLDLQIRNVDYGG